VVEPISRTYDRLVTEMHLPGGPLNGSAETLSPRELEILEMAARGLTNDQMAKNLRISVHGVKFHLGSIYRKLGVSNRTEAAVQFLMRGQTVAPSAEPEGL
jgi:DNA-binding CsgD family transcriptional regulator